jgi:hypothetical protein
MIDHDVAMMIQLLRDHIYQKLIIFCMHVLNPPKHSACPTNAGQTTLRTEHVRKAQLHAATEPTTWTRTRSEWVKICTSP